jgi:hypothetical protein
MIRQQKNRLHVFADTCDGKLNRYVEILGKNLFENGCASEL